MQTFEDKFNEITKNAFDYLKLRNAQYIIDESTLIVQFAYPESREKEALNSREEICEGVKRTFVGDISNIEIKLIKSHFDREFFLRDLMGFLKQFPMLCSMMKEENIETKVIDSTINITFHVDSAIANYCKEKSAGRKIEEHVKNNYCERVKVKFVSSESGKEAEDLEQQIEDEKGRFSLDNVNLGRVIQPQNVETLIGNIVYDKARYIEDVRSETASVVICGTVSGLREMTKKDNPEKKFYKFFLRDYTKEITCLYFPTKKYENQVGFLKDGKQIVCRGRVSEDKSRGSSLTFWPHDISLCTLPEDFIVNRLRRKPDDKYHFVFPQKYVSIKQANLFDNIESPPEFLLGKTFCVFDLETTGFAPETDRIIEIGAVRIVDGKFVDTFNTYLDPKFPIPEKIVKLTGIKDSDVMGQPVIEEVLPDFFKYTQDTILVGQNVQFDYGFISLYGARQNIYFENEMMDTLILAKKYIPGLGKYKLSNLTKHFNIKNESAHRGIYDAIATAEVFLELAKFII